MRTLERTLGILLPVLFTSLGCGASANFGEPGLGGGYAEAPPLGPGAQLGVTPGGAQDIRYARELIGQGQVPPADSITVEGLLSEHDLPTTGGPCEGLMCLRPALAVAPSLETGQLEHWLQLGMTSGLDAATFERPPLDVVVAIDKGGSMSGDLAETTAAVARLIRGLGEHDRIGIVTFDDDTHLLRELGPVGDGNALLDALRGLTANGSSNIGGGTKQAFALFDGVPEDPTRLRRVMVFACDFPLIGDRSTRFSEVVERGAERGIGMSYFGVLLSYSPELADLLGQVHGGAAYYLDGFEALNQVFVDDLDVMVTPVAYDLHLQLSVDAGFRIERLYGIPGDHEGEPRADLDVVTAFLSHRRGAMAVRLSRTDQPASQEVATVALSYTPEAALGYTQPDTQSVSLSVPAEALDENGHFYGSPGARKTVALVNQAERMRTACQKFAGGDRDGAAQVLEELEAYLAGEAAALADGALDREVALVASLLDLVRGS
jgi:Ca-activated chloride channel family protein